jgi:hypothetical protein
MKKITKIVITTLLAFSFGTTFSQTTDSLSISPNPISSSTIIHFEIGQTDTITLVLFNRWGQIVKTFYDSTILQSGTYNINWPDDSLINGTYILLLNFGSKKHLAKTVVKNDLTANLDDNKSYRKDLLIFPNPTKDYITIPIDDNKTITIKDQNGRTIKSFTTDQRTISISDLETGQYFITVSTDKNEVMTIQKIIKND